MEGSQEANERMAWLASDGSENAWAEPVRTLLERAPEPEQALRSAEGLLDATDADGSALGARIGEQIDALEGDPAETLARILLALCGVAPFFVRILERHTEWVLEWLDDDLSQPRQRDDLAARLARQLDGAPDPSQALRDFKYFELARLTIRDCCDAWVPLEESAITLSEISQLADVILDSGLRVAEQEVRAALGPPHWRTQAGEDVELSFCVLGLGKLGSEELNYSSDVDLIYVHTTPPGPLSLSDDDSGEYASQAPIPYFTRLAQAFGKLMSASTADGFLYRVDLDLRPDGAQGALVVGDESLATYYEAWADTWERAAFMKARPVAGDLELGWSAIRQVDPMIYQSGMDFSTVEGIRGLKAKVEEAHGRAAKGWNVKIDSGGIRDVEFLAQAMQLLHGGRIRQVRARSTQRALLYLAEVGLLPKEEVLRLLSAYRFLRRVENRIQMHGERQIHRVPNEGPALDRLARAVGFVGEYAAADFVETLEAHRASVRTLFGSSCAESGRERILELFTRNVPYLLELPSTRHMIEALAEEFARNIDESSDGERSLNNLDRFIQSIGSRRFYYELLLDRPELVPRLTGLFESSKYLSSYLASHPTLIEPVFADPNVLLLTRQQLESDLRNAMVGPDEAEEMPADERALDGLRIFQHRQLLNVGLLDISEKITRADAEHSLTEIAEVCLDGALALASRQLAASKKGVPEAAERGAFLVVGMGKLGSRELSYGSDLDLIFLYDLQEQDLAAKPMAQDYFVRLTQRLISGLQMSTAEGSCYEIDARLRPSGNQGTLVTSLDAFDRYHHDGAAEVWERQVLLRARPVAGDADLAERFEALRREILLLPLPEDLAQEIARIRQRMEEELARATQRTRNFKTGRGGLLDVETAVQFLVLRNAPEHPELIQVQRLELQLEQLETAGLLDAGRASALREGWEFLQRLGNRLRIIENRSISDLDSERGDLDGLARRLGYPAGGREGGARRALLRDYQHHTEAIRAAYEGVMG
jgi:glutamate-ammonia-ligase adenylyltransferase